MISILQHHVLQRTDAVCLLECNNLQFGREMDLSRMPTVKRKATYDREAEEIFKPAASSLSS